LKVLIIGIKSFLAQAVANYHLVNDGCSVIGVYSQSKPDLALPFQIISFKALTNLRDDFDIVHLVAGFVPNGSSSGSELLHTTNVLLPELIAKKFPTAKIVFASSVSIYGQAEGIITETTESDNPNDYGLSKLMGERVIERAASSFSIVRYSSIFGLGMNEKTIIPQFINQAKINEKIQVFGNGSRLQNYIHVNDAAAIAYKAAYIQTNQIYLGVSSIHLSNIELAHTIKQSMPQISINFTGIDTSASYMYNNEWTLEQLRLEPIANVKIKIGELFNQWKER
jgi:UDP-glucose 4-epimerase